MLIVSVKDVLNRQALNARFFQVDCASTQSKAQKAIKMLRHDEKTEN
jgi:hypothetical protein